MALLINSVDHQPVANASIPSPGIEVVPHADIAALQNTSVNPEADALATSLKQHLNEPGNLQQWLHNFWSNCQQLIACLQDVNDYQETLSVTDFTQLQGWIIAYEQYLSTMQQTTMSMQLDPQERFTKIVEIREQFFDQDLALVFGTEHQFAQLQQELHSFWRNKPNNEHPRDTLNSLYEWQSQQIRLLGKHADNLLSADALYQQALPLLEEMNSNDKQYWNQELLKFYFPENWQQVEQVQQQQQAQQVQQVHYQLKKNQITEKWLALKSKMPTADWHSGFEAELAELRQVLISNSHQ